MDAKDLVQHYEAIRRFVRRQDLTAEDAEDVTQIVFAEAIARAPAIDSAERSPLAWLYTVARRRSIDLARKHRREPTGSGIGDSHGLKAEHGRLGASTGVYGAEVRRALDLAIRALPSNQRGVVVRRLVLGWSFAEIARAEGATEAACKMRFVRGLTSIREALEREGTRP